MDLALVPGGVATSIALFIATEVGSVDPRRGLGSIAGLWHCAFVTMRRMVGVVDVAPKIAGAVKPRASANKHVSTEPFRAVVARGSAAIRCGVVVTVGAYRGDTDIDGDGRLRFGTGRCEAASGNGSQH